MNSIYQNRGKVSCI